MRDRTYGSDYQQSASHFERIQSGFATSMIGLMALACVVLVGWVVMRAITVAGPLVAAMTLLVMGAVVLSYVIGMALERSQYDMWWYDG